MESIHWKIYVIKDSTGTPRYVGKTTASIQRRFKRHIDAVLRDPRPVHKDRWLSKLLKTGAMPTVELLEEGLGEGWQEAEIRQIKLHREKYGNLITNSTDGGDGGLGIKHTEETKRKISLINKGRKHTPETRAKMSAYRKGRLMPPRTPEHGAKISAALKGRKRPLEMIEKQRATMTGKILGPNSWEAILHARLSKLRKKTGLSDGELKAMPEYFLTPETIEIALARNSGNIMKTARDLRVDTNMIRYYDPRKKLIKV